jgi:hypothetical protein
VQQAVWTEDHLLYVRSIGQHRDDDVRALRCRRDAAGHDRALPRKLLARLGTRVVRPHLVAGPQEVGCHLAPHHAKPDEPYR